MPTLLALAEDSDTQAVPDGLDVPAEIARREERLSTIAKAKSKSKIEQRAAERHQLEQQEYEAKTANRQAQREATTSPEAQSPSGRKQTPRAPIKSI